MANPLLGAWWLPEYLPCPLGGTFKLYQSWRGGFKAVVVMGEWVPDRRVRVHFPGSTMPSFSRPTGASLLESDEHSAVFVLGSSPGAGVLQASLAKDLDRWLLRPP